ncbi:hypothetical protein R1flu_008041 [Riccia fluitans]|uniref:Uncharacterized protein n=1 Tax=Riccia fluitans TaxID=41844 RepID=A0ABD1YAK2_9MARC
MGLIPGGSGTNFQVVAEVGEAISSDEEMGASDKAAEGSKMTEARTRNGKDLLIQSLRETSVEWGHAECVLQERLHHRNAAAGIHPKICEALLQLHLPRCIAQHELLPNLWRMLNNIPKPFLTEDTFEPPCPDEDNWNRDWNSLSTE